MSFSIRDQALEGEIFESQHLICPGTEFPTIDDLRKYYEKKNPSRSIRLELERLQHGRDLVSGPEYAARVLVVGRNELPKGATGVAVFSKLK